MKHRVHQLLTGAHSRLSACNGFSIHLLRFVLPGAVCLMGASILLRLLGLVRIQLYFAASTASTLLMESAAAYVFVLIACAVICEWLIRQQQ